MKRFPEKVLYNLRLEKWDTTFVKMNLLSSFKCPYAGQQEGIEKRKVWGQKNSNLVTEMAAHSNYAQNGTRPIHHPDRALPPGERMGGSIRIKKKNKIMKHAHRKTSYLWKKGRWFIADFLSLTVQAKTVKWNI